MAWNNRENNSTNRHDQKPVIDRCINCGDHEQVHASQLFFNVMGAM